MTQIKTAELVGAALDWAVAKCDGNAVSIIKYEYVTGYTNKCTGTRRMINAEPLCFDEDGEQFNPSTDWAQGGPIIEREGINLRAIRQDGHSMNGQWLSAYDDGNTGSMVRWVKRADWPRHYWQGTTPLIAAMRCYVASKLGDMVEVPKELIK